MQFILLIFILVPIIEIAVFFQVGSLLGLTTTLLIVFITAIIGVNLLKQQGLKTWTDIQLKMAQGQVPAMEMASAAQLLFAGGLLLTPGFVTDLVGFALMIPAIRMLLANQLTKRWVVRASGYTQNAHYNGTFEDLNGSQARTDPQDQGDHKKSRVIEGEFDDESATKSVNTDADHKN